MKYRTLIALGIASMTLVGVIAWWFASANGPSPQAASVALGQEFELKVGATSGLARTNWAITLVRLAQDSRCPANVTCIRAGDVTAEFLASGPEGSETPSITLGAGSPASADFDGHSITILRVMPYPATLGAIRQEDYAVTLVVRPNQGGRGQAGIRGLVTLGPLCPVVRTDQPCPDEPYEATLLVFDASSHQVASVQSSADGTFSVALAPGTYRIAPQSPAGSPLPRAPEVNVVVPTGAWVVVDVKYDTGIR